MEDNRTVIILAAGEGSRMRSSIPKALHTVCGRPMLDWVLNALPESETPPVAVVGFGAELIKERYKENLRYASQIVKGTGGALLSAMEHIKDGRVLVIAADLPLILPETVSALTLISSSAAFLCATLPDPAGFGRVLRENNVVKGIVDACDVTAAFKHIYEVRVSAYCFDGTLLMKALNELRVKQSGFAMSEVIDWFIQNGEYVDALPIPPEEAISVNDRVDLSESARRMRLRINRKHMLEGVTFIDPSAAYIDGTVRLGCDCVIYPGVVIEGETSIGEGTVLYPACRINESTIGTSCVLQGVIANEAVVGDNVCAGPYVNLRPGANIANGCKIGNYIEVKNSNVGEGTKLPHLSYIGDSDLGQRVNMGCGCVTVNYDSVKKHRTIIGDDAFIGCHTSLVAPVRVGNRAYTGAGSVITRDVPDDALALGRARQTNKEEYARKLRKK